MDIIQMQGYNAYHNYCAAYKDCAPPKIPRFTCVQDFTNHSGTLF